VTQISFPTYLEIDGISALHALSEKGNDIVCMAIEYVEVAYPLTAEERLGWIISTEVRNANKRRQTRVIWRWNFHWSADVRHSEQCIGGLKNRRTVGIEYTGLVQSTVSLPLYLDIKLAYPQDAVHTIFEPLACNK
jgi:hypothetical protein